MGGEHHSFFDNGDESILPVEYVSWFDAVSYCNKRSIMDGLKPAYTINGETVTWNKSVRAYRLLTEAEWEFACRGGTKTPFNVGDNIVSGAQANYNGTVPYAGYRESSYWEKTWSVRIGTPNDNGLYNMHGNVCEWCWDLYGAYSAEDQVDPCGPEEGDNRVARGGCWYDGAAQCRSASRRFYEPYGQIGYIGFRVAFGGL
jgi:formylglycine-generating enzyme required for sulfatase activity